MRDNNYCKNLTLGRTLPLDLHSASDDTMFGKESKSETGGCVVPNIIARCVSSQSKYTFVRNAVSKAAYLALRDASRLRHPGLAQWRLSSYLWCFSLTKALSRIKDFCCHPLPDAQWVTAKLFNFQAKLQGLVLLTSMIQKTFPHKVSCTCEVSFFRFGHIFPFLHPKSMSWT